MNELTHIELMSLVEGSKRLSPDQKKLIKKYEHIKLQGELAFIGLLPCELFNLHTFNIKLHELVPGKRIAVTIMNDTTYRVYSVVKNAFKEIDTKLEYVEEII